MFIDGVEEMIKAKEEKWTASFSDPKVRIRYNTDLVHDYENSNYIWLPRLDQSIKEIRRRGYWLVLSGLEITIGKRKPADIIDEINSRKTFNGNDPDEFTAQALLWILEQEKGDK